MTTAQFENGLDPLTGLKTYAAVAGPLEERMTRAESGEGALSLAVVDLDSFAKVNERHGRDGGDRVLRALGNHLSGVLGPGAEVVRFGGDALLVIFEGLEKERAFLRMEEARCGFAEVSGVGATFSAGVAACPDDGVRAQEVLRKAVDALYRAKATGREKVCLAREEKMVTKTTYYTQGQLAGLQRMAKRMGISEADLLREALDDLLRKHNA